MQETFTVTYSQEVKDKTEKIVAGLHVLTNHIADNNLLKAEIRNTAVSLLSQVLGSLDVRSQTQNLSSFIRVATLAQDITKENANIIILELAKIKGTKDTPELQDLFTSFVPEQISTSDTVKNETLSMSVPQALEPVLQTETQAPKSFTPTPVKDYSLRTTQSVPYIPMKKDTPQTSTKDTLKDASPRRQKVVSLLSFSDAKSIKDISRHFNDCSEKTIQRELNDLVDAKIITRIGDRRWSTYKRT